MKEKLQRIMVSRKEAAELYGMSAGTLGNWFSQRRGPKAYKCGTKTLYKISDLEEFFTANPVLTTDSLEEK